MPKLRSIPGLRAALGSVALSVTAFAAVPAGADQHSFQSIWLKEHNDARAAFGSAPLRWNRQLEDEAYRHARNLARIQRLEHTPYEARGGQGENLWMGVKRYYSARTMIRAFVDERRYFRPGKFPNVSSTPDWADVGHYTQIVWPSPREVGCALAEGRDQEVLVCRYYPAGNVLGEYIAPAAQGGYRR